MDNCIFCKIAKGEIPTNKLYEDDRILAFYDADPQAPVHFLVIPKQHIQSAQELNDQNSEIVSYIFKNIPQIAAKAGLTNGYRIVNNCGEEGGQTVQHLHFHVLGGRFMSWPPGQN